MMKAVSTSETSADLYQTTRGNIPEDSHLHIRSREKLESNRDYFLLFKVPQAV
jgi:hypothetical protein